MNKDLKIPKWIPGPPGTGKTHIWLKDEYTKFLKKNISWERIVVLSHTNVAAKQIIKSIKKIPEMENIPDTKLQDNIRTIHSYFKSKFTRLGKYERADHEGFCKQNPEMKHWSKMKRLGWEKHPLYQISSHSHGKNLTFPQYWATLNEELYENYSLNKLIKLKIKYDKYRELKSKISFEDMIDNFRFKAEVPTDIDVLIVDEAQDCNRPQTHALQIAATNTKEFIFIGDADQTIYDYSGADSNFFYKLSSTPEAQKNQLKYGLRCGKTINEICKRIIAPVWAKWGKNAERIWTPAKDIIGKAYWIPHLNQSCKSMDILLDKIKNTDETFLFTYRGLPTNDHISLFLKNHGIDYKFVSNEKPHVAREDFRCFKQWPNFINNKVSKKQIMDFWPLMGKNVKVYRKCSVDVLKPLIDKEYNIQELIDMGFILPEVKQYDSFSQVLTDKDLLPKVPYIIKVIKNGFDTEKMPRVELDSIHKVKGLTFDNIIVDLTTYRDERNKDEERRIAYVAYSRGRKDCWTIGTSNFKFKNNLAGIQNNRNYYLYGEKNNDTQRYV